MTKTDASASTQTNSTPPQPTPSPQPSPPPSSINVSLYEADFALLDRYQGFSSELLRLSMLGVAVVGFFVSELGLERATSGYVRTSAWLTLVFFVLSTAGALAHRYYSTDGMYHHLRAARYGFPLHGALAESEDVKARRTLYNLSGKCLAVSTFSLAIGAVWLGATFVFLLWFPGANGADLAIPR